VIFLVVAPCILMAGNHCFGGHATFIFRIEVCGQADVFTVLLPTQRGS
jgi:hypothetical protein